MSTSKAELDERLAFLGFSELDRSLLASLEPLLEQHADRLVAAFYRHLLSFEATRKLLADEPVKERLLDKQRAYLLGLAHPSLDEDFLADRRRIGEVHHRIGLDPAWYLGAYSLYFSLLAPLLGEAYRAEPERACQTVVALMKLLMLDAQLAIGAYIRGHDQALEHLNRELAASSRELAREYEAVEHERRQTERRAQAAENLASVATLVAGLAHEIGTPMGVIRGHAEGLESSVEGEKAQWRVRIIREQIDRISTIIESLLNVARPRAEVRVPVAVAEVIDTALTFLSEKLEHRGVAVKRAYRRTVPVRADPDKLQQLFLNLFLNAIDAMPDGGTLGVSVASGKGGTVAITVTDTGVGIPVTELPSVFKPFYTTKPAGRGSGLGLVVAHSIVADHAGRIEVESEVGRGTRFLIRLPRDPACGDAPSAPA